MNWSGSEGVYVISTEQGLRYFRNILSVCSLPRLCPFVISLKCPCAALLYGLCYPTEIALESAQATLAICCLTVRYGCKQYLIGRLGAYMYVYDWLCKLTTNKKSS